jgi:hypothetical protein
MRKQFIGFKCTLCNAYAIDKPKKNSHCIKCGALNANNYIEVDLQEVNAFQFMSVSESDEQIIQSLLDFSLKPCDEHMSFSFDPMYFSDSKVYKFYYEYCNCVKVSGHCKTIIDAEVSYMDGRAKDTEKRTVGHIITPFSGYYYKPENSGDSWGRVGFEATYENAPATDHEYVISQLLSGEISKVKIQLKEYNLGIDLDAIRSSIREKIEQLKHSTTEDSRRYLESNYESERSKLMRSSNLSMREIESISSKLKSVLYENWREPYVYDNTKSIVEVSDVELTNIFIAIPRLSFIHKDGDPASVRVTEPPLLDEQLLQVFCKHTPNEYNTIYSKFASRFAAQTDEYSDLISEYEQLKALAYNLEDKNISRENKKKADKEEGERKQREAAIERAKADKQASKELAERNEAARQAAEEEKRRLASSGRVKGLFRLAAIVVACLVVFKLCSSDNESPQKQTKAPETQPSSAPVVPTSSQSPDPTPTTDQKHSGPVVKAVKASAQLPNSAKYNYSPDNILDMTGSMAWCVKGGPGETITVELEEPTVIGKVSLLPGMSKSAELFQANNRAKSITILIRKFNFKFDNIPDSYSEQTFSTPNTLPVTSFSIKINDVYQGSKANDLCLSKLQVFGRQ